MALFIVGCGLLSYGDTALPHIKAKQADEWMHVVHAHRIARLMKREEVLIEGIAELSERFEREKKALREIREERMAEERMMGFLEGIQKYPTLHAHHSNPRNRLRVVPGPDDSSAEPEKAG
ncbi:hypothetical protein [Streptomyces spectabilis]|uniref:Uncharacterized protein n=1 Tax=Streptomyces spectabilis TaxID=68270 RepID=A0A5P2X7T1_STRST|nr:hypothetical protein [Streptomyces spectabilis]MBB5103246.1 hypothetical protein [Streptomyces spectabilis]MCI3902438.1 hypothetical protein [Streptomyces spectabilis]QEV59784.1 hypothetical protein CP982_14425 [Streptomyces spectabilis]